MLVPLVAADGGTVEWALVELQGRIEQQLDVPPGAPLPVGTLQLSPTNPDIVQMQVGYHLIEGKKMPLKKPLAILERRSDAAPGATLDQDPGGAAAAGAPPHSGALVAAGGGAQQAAGSGEQQRAEAGVSGGEQRAEAGGGGGGDEMAVDESGGSGSSMLGEPPRPAPAAGPCRYEVVGIIRHKYLFKNRPKALISKPTGRGGGS